MDHEEEHKSQQQVYKKIKVLGEGSMGKAYLVQCSEDGKLYVMKRINIGHLSEQQKQNASRQAQLHSLLQHENIIAFKQVYQTTKDKLCLIMEYAENGDLDQLIKSRQGKYFDEDTILEYFTQMCLGLRVIHQNKIIHRDLKGANIFVSSNNTLKIGDFGISKVLDKTVLASKSFVGTPYYLSPQMVEGKPYSTKADIWALGVILYHICAHKLPFETNSLPLLALKIIKGSFPPITGGNYSKQLKSTILNLLQVDPKKRPSVDQIFKKPFLSKYVPKEILDKVQQKYSIKHTKITSNLNAPVPKPQKKPKLSEEQTKQQQKAKREQYKSKRQQMRQLMREDLRKKRKQSDKTSPSENHNLQVNSSTILLKRKAKKQNSSKTNLSRVIPKHSNGVADQKTQVNQKNKVPLQKPWKKNKVKSKNDIEVQLFLPECKPKEKRIEPKQPSNLNQKDFKVQIFISTKPLVLEKPTLHVTYSDQAISERQQNDPGFKKPPAEDRVKSQTKIQNYHYSQKNIKSADQQEYQVQEQQVEEEIQSQPTQLRNVLRDVKGVGQLVSSLGNPYGAIELYEQSGDFDNTIEKTEDQSNVERHQMSNQDYQNMKYITNSQNLQEIRLILEERLGQQQFFKAYNIMLQHSQESARKAYEHPQQFLDDDYAFNRQILKQKLKFLTPQEFQKNIVLLYTLMILEDQEMKNNFEQNHSID